MAITSRRLPWWQRLRWERLIAASVAMALNVGVLWFLGRQMDMVLTAEDEKDYFTELVFIQKEPEPPILRSAASANRHRPETTNMSARPRPVQLSTRAATQNMPVAEPISPGDLVSTTGRALNLSVPDAWMSFERNPVAKQEAALAAAAPARVALKFKDRSFGGMMQRMTSASICRDLRKVLNTSPANAASIIASMESYGCKV